MESDDDFLPPTQFGTQHRGTNRQAVTSTSRPQAWDTSTSRWQAWDRPGPSRHSQISQSRARPSQSQDLLSQSQGRHSQSQDRLSQSQDRLSQSQARSSQDEELSQIKEGMEFLMGRIQQLTGDRGIKRPAEPKPFDKKPDTKEQCQLCKKYYANKTTLFRHYRAMHGEMNPEKYHGCSVNSTVVSLDTSFRENTCSICDYVAGSQNALDTHNRDVHGNVVNSNNANNRAVANVNSSNDVNITEVASASNKENISNNTIMNKLYKCEPCACYFEERNKFDEHMKVQHGYQFVCHICNKHLLFKNVDGHVKEVHPDVYKNNKEKDEKVIVKKMMRNTKGKKVLVFVCTKCDLKMVDKIEAEKHDRGHKKGLKIKVASRVKVYKAGDNFTAVTSNNHVILTCDACDISTGSYDAAVEHAQNHVTNNLNDIVTQQCLICELKFEPFCYKNHVDLHYKNKEIHKESFRYFKYRPQVLLYENCFDTEPKLKKIIDESIYRHTRSVRMRVAQGGTYNLYKCCQCDNFVEPAAVLNHAINYDTCVKVKCSYTCDICDRKFNNRLARNNHANDHKSEENYKTVLFNHENDKAFNKILNNRNDADAPKVLFKCLCSLCFVRKVNADVHIKICPGKDPRTSCPKCSNFFNPEELLAHCFEQHLDQTRIVIENIIPDVIDIDEDEETEKKNADIIEIDTSDDDEADSERFDNIKIEVLTHGDAENVTGSREEAEKQNRKDSGAITEAGENEQVASEGNLLIAKSEKDIDEDRWNEEFGGTDGMTDDDSQDTITYEKTVNATDVVHPVMNKQDKVKCVPTNLLLNPLNFRKKVGVLNAEITAGIESFRQQLETTNALCNVLIDATIKKEESWFDPTNFSNIRGRPSLRHPVPPSNLSQDIVDILLTDDEETEMNHDEDDTESNDNIRSAENNDTLNKGSVNNDMREDLTNKICITEQRQNDTVDMNDEQLTSNNDDITSIAPNEENNIEESASEKNADTEAQPELTNINVQGVTNDSTHSSHEEAVYNDQNYSNDEDDLFIPSGIENSEKSRNTELNNAEREITNNEQLVTQVDSANKKKQSDNNVEESEVDPANDKSQSDYNIEESEVESANDKSQSDNNIQESEVESVNDKSQSYINIEEPGSICVENTQEDTETNDIRSGELNIELNGTEIDKETYVSIEHVQTNFDEDTREYVESTLRETSTYTISDIAGHEVREEISEKQTVNIKKEFGYMNINIKRELIEENLQDNEKGCEKVRIKPEPIDYNENNVDNVNYNNCSIC